MAVTTDLTTECIALDTEICRQLFLQPITFVEYMFEDCAKGCHGRSSRNVQRGHIRTQDRDVSLLHLCRIDHRQQVVSHAQVDSMRERFGSCKNYGTGC